MAQVVCRACGVEFALVRKDGEVVIEYDMANWKARCTSPNIDSPTQCPVMSPQILTLVQAASKKPDDHCT
jgi:hypothetical protein